MADYILINSLSRSGGTFLKALFEPHPKAFAFPIEFPTKGLDKAGFLSQESFERIKDASEWLQCCGLDYHLQRFYDAPYGRSFGRGRKTGEPEIYFNYPLFQAELNAGFKNFRDVGEAYEGTWKLFFEKIYVNEKKYFNPENPAFYVNHYATNTLRDYGNLRKEAPHRFQITLLHILRDPYENIISLKKHWWRISESFNFVKISMARWEMAFYAALRNQILHPDRCEIILYDSDPEKIKEQFKNSKLSLLREMAGAPLKPTVFGIPLSGQSYKEKEARRVSEPYKVGDYLSPEEIEFIQTSLGRIFSFAGIRSLSDLQRPLGLATTFQEVLGLSSDFFEMFLSSFHVALDGYVMQHVERQKNLYQFYRDRPVTEIFHDFGGALLRKSRIKQ